MLGLGLDIRKDQGSGLSGSGSDPEVGELFFVTTGGGTGIYGDDEQLLILLYTGNEYTNNLLSDGTPWPNNDVAALEGSFNVTIQRVSGSDGSETVDAESTGTCYGYAIEGGSEFTQVVLSTNNSYTGGDYFLNMFVGLQDSVDATTFGGSDITTTQEARYRAKFTYTIGGDTSEEFTTSVFMIDAA